MIYAMMFSYLAHGKWVLSSTMARPMSPASVEDQMGDSQDGQLGAVRYAFLAEGDMRPSERRGRGEGEVKEVNFSWANQIMSLPMRDHQRLELCDLATGCCPNWKLVQLRSLEHEIMRGPTESRA